MRRDRFAGWIVNEIDHTRIERHDRAQLVGDERNGVAEIERRTDRLRDLVEGENFSLRFTDRTETGDSSADAENVRCETRVGFRRCFVVDPSGVDATCSLMSCESISRSNSSTCSINFSTTFGSNALPTMLRSRQATLRASCPCDTDDRNAWRRKIDHRDDARDEWNPFAFEAFGIATAVPLLVVITHDVFNRVREVDAFENVATHGRVNLHLRKLGFGEFPGLLRMYSGTASLPMS